MPCTARHAQCAMVTHRTQHVITARPRPGPRIIKGPGCNPVPVSSWLPQAVATCSSLPHSARSRAARSHQSHAHNTCGLQERVRACETPNATDATHIALHPQPLHGRAAVCAPVPPQATTARGRFFPLLPCAAFSFSALAFLPWGTSPALSPRFAAAPAASALPPPDKAALA